MEKREKIIVAITLIVVMYGALDFFVLSGHNTQESLTPETQSSQFITTIATQLSHQADGSRLTNAIKRIQTPWREEVFFKKPAGSLFAITDKQKDTANNSIQFDPNSYNYTGYLEMGNNKIAIINGTDYTTGDSVNGATLVAITPKTVEISIQGKRFKVDIRPVDKAE